MKTHAVPELQIVVLAAGESRRLGEPKALARIRGCSLLRRTARRLSKLTPSPLRVVVPPRSARHRAELRGIPTVLHANPRASLGLSSSVRLGLVRARFGAAVLLVPVDLAALKRRDIARLIAVWRASRRRIAARRIGSRGGAPLIVPRKFFGRAGSIDGDVGLRDWLRQLPVSEIRLVDLPSAALDIDTPAELRRARRTLLP